MILRRVTTRATGAPARAGFTLAELLAVVAILAILAGVAIPSYMAIVSGQKLKVARSNCKMYAETLKQYAVNNVDNPNTVQGYPAQTGDLSFLVGAGLLSQPPATPWGGDYFYELLQNPNTGIYEPVVYCQGPNGERIDSTGQ